MLKKKESEEVTQKLVCYGTILICLLYMIKLLKRYVSFRKCTSRQELRPIIRQSCLLTSPAQSHVTLKPRRPRHKRRHQTMAEQWLPRDDVSHEHDFEETDYSANDYYPNITTAEIDVDGASVSNNVSI